MIGPRLLRKQSAADSCVYPIDGLATGRMVRILSVADAYTRECLALEADTSLGSGLSSLGTRDAGAGAADRRAWKAGEPRAKSKRLRAIASGGRSGERWRECD